MPIARSLREAIFMRRISARRRNEGKGAPFVPDVASTPFFTADGDGGLSVGYTDVEDGTCS
jgi:hypothetical protein